MNSSFLFQQKGRSNKYYLHIAYWRIYASELGHILGYVIACYIWLLLLKWWTLIPAWTSDHMPRRLWDEIYLSIPKLQRFHPTLFWVSNCLSILGLKLIHVSKRGHLSAPSRYLDILLTHWDRDKMAANFLTTFLKAFFERIWVNFDYGFIEICPHVSN